MPADPDAELTEAEVAELAQALRDARAERLARAQTLQDELARRDACSLLDAADVAADKQARVAIAAELQRIERTLQAIDAAEGRLAHGTYGVCLGSGEPIGVRRLRAIPWATTAVVDERP